MSRVQLNVFKFSTFYLILFSQLNPFNETTMWHRKAIGNPRTRLSYGNRNMYGITQDSSDWPNSSDWQMVE